MQNAGRTVLVPSFPEQSRGQAAAIPSLDKQVPSRFERFGDFSQRKAEVNEVRDDLNHRNKIELFVANQTL